MAFIESPVAVNLTGQTSIPPTNYFPIAPPATGMWAVVIVTNAGSAGTVTVNVSWNNGTTAAGLNSSAFSLTSVGEQAAL